MTSSLGSGLFFSGHFKLHSRTCAVAESGFSQDWALRTGKEATGRREFLCGRGGDEAQCALGRACGEQGKRGEGREGRAGGQDHGAVRLGEVEDLQTEDASRREGKVGRWWPETERLKCDGCRNGQGEG